jgi:aspartate aminotransferase
MLSLLPTAEPDPLWDLTREFEQDHRPGKIDLVVGVYRDASGKTPVMRAVREAEAELAAAARSKSYRGLSGNLDFIDGISRFLLGPDSPAQDRQCTLQTVAGTGALRVLADFISRLAPDATVWTTDPAYVNHRPILTAAGLRVRSFRWRENANGLDLQAAFEDLEQAAAGDVLVLHGCCHNPSGIDPSLDQWRALSAFCRDRRVVPFIDMAYQGFGDGVDADAAGLRLMAREQELLFVAASCSKNMGLYCERTGAAMVVASSASQVTNIRLTLERVARSNYSMPPDHGAAVAAMLFARPEPWLEELEANRRRVAATRRDLAAELRAIQAPAVFQSLERQKGMFSLLPLDPSQMNRLREEFAVYGTTGGRINLAGLAPHQIGILARALKAVAEVPPAGN